MKLITKLAAAAAAIAMAMIAAPSAHAAVDWDRCQKGYFCIFEHANGKGKYAMFRKGTGNLADPKVFNGYLNDKASSVWHRDDQGDGSGGIQWWCLREHKDQQGAEWRIKPGTKGNLGGAANESVSSLRPLIYYTRPTGHWSC